MGLKDKLTLITSAKNDIRNKIIDKGVHVPESAPLKDYPNYINNIQPTPITIGEQKEWTPDPLWWDIETILANDVNEGDNAWLDEECGKCILLLDDELEIHEFTLQSYNSTYANTANAIKTSDGSLYLYTNSNQITHRWDRSKDKQSSSANVKTRYVIIYNRHKTYFDTPALQPFLNNCLYLISKQNLAFSSRYDYNAYKPPILKAVKLLGENTRFLNFYSNTFETYNELPVLWCEMLEYFSFDATFERNIRGFLNYAKNLKYYKLKKENHSGIDEITGGKKYSMFECTRDFDVLDVSDIDFSDCASDILTYPTPRVIKGVINLENNVLNGSYTIFKDKTTFDNGEMTFSLNLPTNADVTLRVNRICPASAKYLIEHAPQIEVSHTLYVSENTYKQLKHLDRNFQVIFNGQTYSNGVQVLTLKGWTVQQF